MEVLNFTGKPVGLTNRSGNPTTVLPPTGHARCKVSKLEEKTFDLVPIYHKSYGKVVGLPDPDPNVERLYIVNDDVAKAVGSSRFDLLVVEDPMEWENATFYKSLINI